ncbi:MAG: hypothetical protein ACRDEA_22180 [Microcystaceae cyanobacterium]
MANNWLVNISKAETTLFEKKDREGGFDFESGFHFEKTNNTSIDVQMNGYEITTKTGKEWLINFDIKGLAVLTSADIPSQIKTLITYGEQVDNLRACTITMTTLFQNGQSKTTNEIHLLDTNKKELSVEEYLQGFTKMFSGEPFDKAFLEEHSGH